MSLEDKYDYCMVGHSGTGPEAERLVEWGRPPRTEPRTAVVWEQVQRRRYCCAVLIQL